MSHFLQDLLNLYLLPFMLAVPLAIVVLLVTTRRGDNPADAPARTSTHTPTDKPADMPPTPAPRDLVTRRAQAEAAPLAAAALAAAAAPTLAATPDPAIAAGAAADAAQAAALGAPTIPADWPATQPQVHALLVVDDSAVARAKLRRLFESAGYLVDVANDGVEALERLAQAHYAVLITDLEMPNMDGVELIAAVQGSIATEDLPIIAITGHESLQARVQDCQGLYGLFKKPWHDRELLKRVAALAAMRQPAQQAS